MLRLECIAADLKHTLLSRDLVARARDAGLRVATWTVNDPARAADLLEWGVDTVITDEVERIPPASPPKRAP